MKILTLALLLTTQTPTLARAQAIATPSAPAQQVGGSEEVNVDSMKEKYWSNSDTTEVSVVQNRNFSKARKFQLGAFGNYTLSDPFLNIFGVGGNLGFYFTEYLGVEARYSKIMASPSIALKTFEQFRGATTNTNLPLTETSLDFHASFLYGKLSLLGFAIIYYDLDLVALIGMTKTESGTNLSPGGGLTQRFFLSKYFGLRTDYRLTRYNETIIEKEIPTKKGQPVGTRTNWSHSFVLGVDFLFGFSSKGESGK